jgi:hypothetical protein
MGKVIRLTESDLTRLVRRVIKEQTSKDVGCLLSAGYEKKTIGGPMVRREVYTTTKNGLTYQFDIRGKVRVFGNNTNKTGTWVCESKKIKLVGMKETPNMPM